MQVMHLNDIKVVSLRRHCTNVNESPRRHRTSSAGHEQPTPPPGAAERVGMQTRRSARGIRNNNNDFEESPKRRHPREIVTQDKN
ncbi:hypothetical protein GALMADRAFT_221945 [Galerina marginata CBS 339.88]|uniref:Uncharacterized protein n=1 Tax=Galerina marginata (strain CBS 339.88) TaxID=685588 RepID=A0A067TQ76_GALM3|nr:hypothetical protein GALMADRAFT_221945 [Galerina marginata CBS 339.88]